VAGASPEVEFSYELGGTGWSHARLAFGDRSTEMIASYMTDALRDLLEAVLSLRTGATSAQVSWEEEPGEFRWLFVRDGADVEVRVLWFLRDPGGEEQIAGRVALDALVSAVTSAARHVLEKHGEEGYLGQWVRHPFPTATLHALEAGSAGS
jgi:hypothetical protein